MENFETHGEWLLADTHKWKTGTLRFDQEQGVRLELVHKKPINFFPPDTFQFILGRTGHGDVTLVNCRSKKSQTWFHNKLSFQIFTAQYFFVGSHYNDLTKIQFEKVQFNLHNLSDWINMWGLNYKAIPNEKFSFEYSVPDSLKFNINDDCIGKINFECLANFTNDNERTVTVKESHQIELIYSYAKNFEKILEDVTKFQNLLSIFIYELSFPLYINFLQFKTDNQDQLIKLYYQHGNYKFKASLSQNQIISFKELDNIFYLLIPEWFGHYEKISSALFLFLSTLKEKTSFSSENFLSIIKAIETFHINIFKEKENKNKKLSEKFERIINSIQLPKDKDYIKDLLYERLRPSLKERLNDLIVMYKNEYIEDKIEDFEDFKTKTSDSRNYYTHLDPKMKEKALKGKELYDLYIKLTALYLSVLYSYLKIEKDIFEERLKNVF